MKGCHEDGRGDDISHYEKGFWQKVPIIPKLDFISDKKEVFEKIRMFTGLK